MKKSVTKRIRFTSRGKLVRRKMGLDHFRAKKNRKQINRREDIAQIKSVDRKSILQYLNR